MLNIDILNEKYRVLVTGGAGFIGGCLIRRLLQNKNLKIFNLDKLSYASDLTGIQNCLNNENHILIRTDLSNFDETNKAMIKANPDLIIHLAAESHVDRSIDNARPFIQSNIMGTFNLLESAKLHWINLKNSRKKLFKFLHVSTDEVFGSLGKEGYFFENSQYDPRSPYSASKAASDHLVNAWFHTYEFPIVKTNCSNNFGPYQFPEKLIPLTILKALNTLTIPIYGSGENIRDWLFVEDHVDALILAIDKGKIGETYCIGGNNEKSNIEIAKTICKFIDNNDNSKESCEKLIKFVADRPGHDKRYAINSNFIKKELGWFPKHSFEEAINKTIKWYQTNKSWCERMMKSSNYYGERVGNKNF